MWLKLNVSMWQGVPILNLSIKGDGLKIHDFYNCTIYYDERKLKLSYYVYVLIIVIYEYHFECVSSSSKMKKN
jgi:hypothetical protein